MAKSYSPKRLLKISESVSHDSTGTECTASTVAVDEASPKKKSPLRIDLASTPSSGDTKTMDLSDYIDLTFVLLHELSSLLLKSARIRRDVDAEVDLRLWTSWPIAFSVACILISLATRQVFVLYGCLAAISVEIGWILLKWVLYILDDPKLWSGLSFVQGWFEVVRKEGESAFRGNTFNTLMASGAMLYSAPTGVALTKTVLRWKVSEARRQVIDDCVSGRYRIRVPPSLRTLPSMSSPK